MTTRNKNLCNQVKTNWFTIGGDPPLKSDIRKVTRFTDTPLIQIYIELCFQPPAYFFTRWVEQLYCVVLVVSLSQKDNRNSVSKFQYFCYSTLPKFKKKRIISFMAQVFSPLLPINCWKKSLSTRIISDLKQNDKLLLNTIRFFVLSFLITRELLFIA